jgi:hypothetical protein
MLNLKTLYQDIGETLALKLLNTNILVLEQTNPDYPEWVGYKLIDWTQLAQSASEYETFEDEDSITYVTYSVWVVTLRIVFTGPKSEQHALHFGQHFNKDTFLYSFRELGLAFTDISPIKTAPYKLADGWEQRHILDIKFNIVIEDSEELDFFQSVEVTQEIQDEEGDVIVTRTDEITIQ